uniref:Rab-GAP TBC domain-containing protein n=1 Tax=Gongylonema pulchrum TaxID=637853 RepID=A0A183EK13_9BILA
LLVLHPTYSLLLVESDPCCWNRWIRSVKNTENLFNTDGFQMIVGRVFATEDPVIRCRAIKMLMSSGGVTQHIRNPIWDYCADLLKEIDINRYVSITEREVAIYQTEEGKIRDEMRDLYAKCKERIEPLTFAIEGDPLGSAKHVQLMIGVVVPLLRSPLVSSLAHRAFRAFRDAAFQPCEDYLHELILHCSVRVLNSAYTNAAWSEELLATQLERTVALLGGKFLKAFTERWPL